jgi:glycyl-tRNA synthetase
MKTEELTKFAARTGFFYQSSEIYGGLAGLYDYGHLGAQLKRNIENAWRNYFLNLQFNTWEIEPAELMPEKVFEASGHIRNFNDPFTECMKCGTRYKVDSLIEKKGGMPDYKSVEHMTLQLRELGIKCNVCGGELGEVRWFNMMFEVKVGVTGSDKAYLRPETAQGVYVNFLRQYRALREKLPLGLAIVGKAFRNEISPRQGLIRLREFTQAELQIFFDPDEVTNAEYVGTPDASVRVLRARAADVVTVRKSELASDLPKLYLDYLIAAYLFFVERLGYPPEKIRLRELGEDERAFYNKLHWDIEVQLESTGGYTEIGGVHYRTDHDLSGHQSVSGKELSVTKDSKKFVPHVIELTFGVDRNVWAIIETFYREDKERIWLALPPSLAPIKAAVFPLVSKDGLPEIALRIYRELREKLKVEYDESGSIGRRYRRQDEVGTPFEITIDYQTKDDGTVTVRFRDTMKQIRVNREELAEWLLSQPTRPAPSVL